MAHNEAGQSLTRNFGLLSRIHLRKEAIMADDKTNRGPQDRSRINLSEDYEVRYLTDKLGVSKAQLEETLKEAGVSATAVEEALRKRALS